MEKEPIKELIYYSTFSTKKCLINKLFKEYYNETQSTEKKIKYPCIKVGYVSTLKDVSTFTFLFNNKEVCNEAYDALICYLNTINDTDFVNFDMIFNDIKEKFNKLLE